MLGESTSTFQDVSSATSRTSTEQQDSVVAREGGRSGVVMMSSPESDFRDQMRQVFQVCDKDGRGTISVEHLQALILEHSGEQDLSEITAHLDPAGTGEIGFEDFYEGMKRMVGGFQSDNDKGDDSDLEETKEVMENGYHGNGYELEDEQETNSCNSGTCETSESTYNEYDMTDEDNAVLTGHDLHDDVDSAIGTTPSTDADGFLSVQNGNKKRYTHHHHPSSLMSESTYGEYEPEEERFEDFGEADDVGDEVDLPESDMTESAAEDDQSEQHPDLPPPTPPPMNGHADDEGWYGSNRYFRIMCPPMRRMSSKAVGSHLLGRHNHLVHSTSIEVGTEDDTDRTEDELANKVHKLQSQVSELEEDHLYKNEQEVRLRNENAALQERINLLEEQLRDVEVKAQENLEEERRQHREAMAKQERDLRDDIDLLTNRTTMLEEENSRLKEDIPRYKSTIERLKEDQTVLREQLEETNQLREETTQEHRDLEQRARGERQQYEEERLANHMLIEEMNKELEDLRRYKVDNERLTKSRSPSFLDMPSRYNELEREIRKLKEENRGLREANDDLNVQLLNHSFQEGKNLINGPSSSLASELESASKDEVVEALREQQEMNARMSEYIDRILTNVLEHNPGILECK
ncbi:PREDICTED: rab11 family-interacting protein 4B-like isoform X2 [Branchiostoma belcheri]|uniref:Rab11 family-interacting protein 4B-like isoform X2 n=1 Tax=Branchiostoma belcheri TaxID=7741 RepID=A0A6P5AJA7_BRABE|nr:PREDICTED: rab11 family-interacting protein 4B-like isoform X2 [Branchiostoma belcheri]